MTPDNLAKELEIAGTTLRRWLRKTYPRRPAEWHKPWNLDARQVLAARRRFEVPWSRAKSRRGMLTTTVALPVPVHRRLSAAAAKQRVPLTELIRRSVTESLKGIGKGKGDLASQRFVSPYLTHFVGRKAIEEETLSPQREKDQYRVLHAILSSKRLLVDPNIEPGIVAHRVGMNDPLCSNEMFSVEAVCFCDIPLDDLGVHMEKYGEFGLSFSKRFLIERGASPVFYIAMNSLVPGAEGTPTRREHFNRMGEAYWPIRAFIWSGGTDPGSEDADLHSLLARYPNLRNEPAAEGLHQRLGGLIEFFDRHIFGHIKCFDDRTDDRSAENFYLEREWRLVTGIAFNLEDLAFVIVPRSYEERLRREFAAIPRGKVRLAEDCRRKGRA